MRNQSAGSIDMLIFRENTRGRIRERWRRVYQHSDHDIAIQTSVFTRRGCERIIRAAFEKAMTRPRRRVTSVTKSNAQGYGMVLWDEVFDAVSNEYPMIETESLLVDRAVMGIRASAHIIRRRVASNLFGDFSPIYLPSWWQSGDGRQRKS